MRQTDKICIRFQYAVEIIAKRWTTLILKVLMDGPCRFNELAERVDAVSDRVLSERLKELEAEGIVVRRVIHTSPPRVEYDLTEKGRALNPVLDAIEHWSHEWIPLESLLNPPEAVDPLLTESA